MDYLVKVSSPNFQLPAVVLQNLIHPEAGDGFIYEHIQSQPSAVWLVRHNLGHFPGGVTLLDSAKRIFQAEITYIDGNTLIVSMVGAQSGSAFVN